MIGFALEYVSCVGVDCRVENTFRFKPNFHHESLSDLGLQCHIGLMSFFLSFSFYLFIYFHLDLVSCLRVAFDRDSVATSPSVVLAAACIVCRARFIRFGRVGYYHETALTRAWCDIVPACVTLLSVARHGSFSSLCLATVLVVSSTFDVSLNQCPCSLRSIVVPSLLALVPVPVMFHSAFGL